MTETTVDGAPALDDHATPGAQGRRLAALIVGTPVADEAPDKESHR